MVSIKKDNEKYTKRELIHRVSMISRWYEIRYKIEFMECS